MSQIYNNVNKHIAELMQQRQEIVNVQSDCLAEGIPDDAGLSSQAKAITEMKIDEARRFYLPFNK